MNLKDFYGLHSLHDEIFFHQVLERWKEILQSQRFVEGRYHDSFEERFARLQGAKHCLLVGNGTDALEISLVLGGIGAGDKVGVPGITFHATAEAVVNVGATPVLIDVEPSTGLMDPDSLERVFSQQKLAAVIPVHIYGLPVEMERIEKICYSHKIHIVEDAAQAQGAFYGDTRQPVGSRQSIATFSFYPTKNLGAMGDAGCILTDDGGRAAEIRAIRNHGRGGRGLGRNSRCDHLQAAVLDLKLDAQEGLNRRRKEIATLYHGELKGLPLGLVPEPYLSLSSWHLYPLRLGDGRQAEGMKIFLRERGIAVTDFYAKAISQESWAKGWDGEGKEAESLAGSMVCLPCHPRLTDSDVLRVVDKIREFFSD